MRKFALVVAMLLFVAPAMAAVTVTATPSGTDVTIAWSSTPDIVRAFALDITVDEGAKITATSSPNSNYYIYPGTIVIDAGGVVTDYNTPVAESGDHPDTQPGLGTGGITIEMGSLYAATDPVHNTPPGTSGNLITVTVDLQGAQDCNLTVALNGARCGMVLENGSSPSTNLPTTVKVSGECYAGQPDYAQWVAAGKPICWCYPRQCHGDADGLQEGGGKVPLVWVGVNDLAILGTSWKKNPGDLGYDGCADFDHLIEGGGKVPIVRVGVNDLSILGLYWKDASDGGPAPLPDCQPGNRNP